MTKALRALIDNAIYMIEESRACDTTQTAVIDAIGALEEEVLNLERYIEEHEPGACRQTVLDGWNAYINRR